MLDVSQKHIIELEKLVEKEELNDYLIDFLLNYRNENWEGNTAEFIFADPYESIYRVINADSKEESVDKLKEYLEKKWYKGHNDTGWYDSHENKNDIYNGYWSYESGAIAKILKLDDSSLKNTPYYPYDMVHYQEK
ncbi:PoNe immunity protein domain-containing protein [Bacillus cereus]|uniref:PoNe immunity protein domain-containing protein n=1 Tax=Bacillus cereus TaxID=1396 RepID=UPI001F0B61D8|nr:PoNe immunity protein domain-containing protein [Bacillus cereus]